jgi:hypothetical protein
MDASPNLDSLRSDETEREIVGTAPRPIRREVFRDRSFFLSELPAEMREVLDGLSAAMFNRRFLELTPNHRADVAQKWMNDLIVQGDKAGGSSSALQAKSPSGFMQRLKRFLGFGSPA